MDRGGSLNAPESLGKVGSGRGAGAGVVPPPGTRLNLRCAALHTGEIAFGEMVHSNFKHFSPHRAVYMRGCSAGWKMGRAVLVESVLSGI